VYSAGLGWNDMSLNGQAVSPRSFLNPGLTSYDKTVLYTTDDVTELIRQNPGKPVENVIATQLGSGQYDNETVSGNHGWEIAEWRANPTLKADLVLTFSDGTEQLVRSDDSWQTTDTGPIRYDNHYLGETYDARKELPGWNTPEFAAAGWQTARVVQGPAGTLRAQEDDRTTRTAEWPAGKRSEPQPGVLVYDTGQQRAGWATIAVHGAPAGTPIQVRYGEKLGADGLVSISGYAPAGQIQTDLYIAGGAGTATKPERFAPRFTYKGFQYVQLSGPLGAPLPAGVTVTVQSVQEIRTDLTSASSFSTSSRLVNKIEKLTKASLAENYVAGIITDTPTYEKDGWTGDAQLTVPTAGYMFDVQRQLRKTTRDIVDDQFADGQISLLTPGNANYGYCGKPAFKPANGCATPIWDALLFVAPWELYDRYADKSGIELAYPAMAKYLDEWIPRWFQADDDGLNFTLTSGLGDWTAPTGADAPDGSPTDFNTPRVISLSSTAYVAYMAKLAASSARVLGKNTEAQRFDQLFANIKNDFNAKWWDPALGYYHENPPCDRCGAQPVPVQAAQVLPLAFGLVPDENRQALATKLVTDVLDTRCARHGRHCRHALDSARPHGGRRARRASGHGRGVRDRPADDVSELRILGQSRMDLARRVLGNQQPYTQPPHVRLGLAMVLPEPRGYPTAERRICRDRDQTRRQPRIEPRRGNL
jgi:alpha-L-rhamnosidase